MCVLSLSLAFFVQETFMNNVCSTLRDLLDWNIDIDVIVYGEEMEI